MKTFVKKGLVLLLSTFSLGLSSCFAADLGYEDTETYYKTFGDRADYIYTENKLDSSNSHCAISESLFNNQTANELRSDKQLAYQYYEYLAVQVKEDDFSFAGFDLYLRSKTTKLSPFIVRITTMDHLPGLVRAYDAPLMKENDEGQMEEIPYEDKDLPSVAEETLTVKPEAWVDFLIEDYTIGSATTDNVPVSKGSYIVIQFLNNTGWGKDQGLEPVEISMLNLMIAVYDPDERRQGAPGIDDNDCDDKEYSDPEPYDDE